MKNFAWLLVAGSAISLVWASAARTQEVNLAKAEKALERTNPDEVDPNLIKGQRWTAQFQFSHPQPVLVRAAGGERQVYWYMIYTVTNLGEDDHLFIPAFALVTDTMQVERAGIYPAVYEAIKKARKVPFLENAASMHGMLRVGPDNAKTGVAIFGPLDRKTDAFTIFVGGLSTEYIERPNPAAAEDAPSEDKVIMLRKTLAIEYKLPGDEWWLNLDTPEFVSKRWTWR